IDLSAESKNVQGTTAEITGELGSVAPTKGDYVGGVMQWLSLHRTRIDWKDLDGYWKRLRTLRPAINLGTMVSSAQVRAAVMGEDDRAPTPDELLRMQNEGQEA